MKPIYGQHRHGNEDRGWVAHSARRARAGEPITIYGDEQVRDVLFVEEPVEAFACARRNIGNLSGRDFNIGGAGNTVSLLELIKRLEELSERPVALSFDARRIGDRRYYARTGASSARPPGWRVSAIWVGMLAV